MDEIVLRHMMDVYGINNMMPLPMQFPRLPPGLTHPILKTHQNALKEQFEKDNESISIKLQDFHQMYQKYASGLLEMNAIGLIPPSHPLFNRKNSVETLIAENSKLQQENIELKKQLEKREKSKHH